MNETKSPLSSKTIIFAVLFGLFHLAGLFGYADYTPSGDVTEIVNVIAAGVVLVLRLVTNKGIAI